MPQGKEKESRPRPGGKSSGFVKKMAVQQPQVSKAKQDAENAEPQIPVELQQLLLNIFKNAFPATLESERFKDTLQEIKNALFERDFERAFGKEEYLEAYALRWSPSRALCYASILVNLWEFIRPFSPAEMKMITPPDEWQNLPTDYNVRVFCLGGGAAEIVGLAGLSRHLSQNSISNMSGSPGTAAELLRQLDPNAQSTVPGKKWHPAKVYEKSRSVASGPATPKVRVIPHVESQHPNLDVHLFDTADWKSIDQTLDKTIGIAPPLSAYASATAKANNKSLVVEGKFSVDCQQKDLLTMSTAEIHSMFTSPSPNIITMFFTLNELYSASISKTSAFLLAMTGAVTAGQKLVIVDSAGSYSETKVGDSDKRYPMVFLLDHVLLEADKSEEFPEGKPRWKKVLGEGSRWFRLDEQLKYPVSLENMRYQVHVYMKL